MKHEWKKVEKQFYLPKNKPELVNIPLFKYFTIEGKGNPNDAFFTEYIAVLYSVSYAVKMSPKKGIQPCGYYDYTVYPLEGIWNLSDEIKNSFSGVLIKNDLVFKLMIRQPDFVDNTFANFILEQIKKSKPSELLDKVCFEDIIDGYCIQMMHLGPYDSEPDSFKMMHDFAEKLNYVPKSKAHREIYLNDARKVVPDKLKTVLRFSVDKK